MLLRQLEYLVALARERHYARAAVACCVSQPALSTGIRKLESDLDLPIVQHGARFEGLTPEGERVLLWAHRILRERDTMQQDLTAMRGRLTGTLRLGVIPTASPVGSLLTTPFCEQHPHAKVRLESLSSRGIMHRLTEFEIDAALTYLDDDALHGVRKIPLYDERYLLLTPADGPLAAQEKVRWAQVADLPLCLLDAQMRNRRILNEFFIAEGTSASPAIEADTVADLYAHLASGRWSSVISHAWLHMFGIPAGMRVVRLTPDDTAQRPRVGLVLIEHERESAIVEALLAVARGAGLRDALDALLDAHLDS